MTLDKFYTRQMDAWWLLLVEDTKDDGREAVERLYTAFNHMLDDLASGDHFGKSREWDPRSSGLTTAVTDDE